MDKKTTKLYDDAINDINQLRIRAKTKQGKTLLTKAITDVKEAQMHEILNESIQDMKSRIAKRRR